MAPPSKNAHKKAVEEPLMKTQVHNLHHELLGRGPNETPADRACTHTQGHNAHIHGTGRPPTKTKGRR